MSQPRSKTLPKPLTILYAGGSSAYSERVRQVCEQCEHVFNCVRSGNELIGALSANKKIDFVIADIDAPGVGIETLRKIRARFEFKGLPIILLSTSEPIKTLDELHGLYWHKGDNALVAFEHFFVEVLKTLERKSSSRRKISFWDLFFAPFKIFWRVIGA